MKIGTLRGLRSWAMRKRKLHQRSYEEEVYGPMNLYRPRVAGRIETYDAVIDRIDGLLKSHRDKYANRKKR